MGLERKEVVSLILTSAVGGALFSLGVAHLFRLRDPDDRLNYLAGLERAGFESFRFGSAYAANRRQRARNAYLMIVAGLWVLAGTAYTLI